MDSFEIKPGRYRHFKGNEYEVLFTAKHSETLEEMVVYRALYGDRGIWVRPASMWNETVERDGRAFRRFEYIGPDVIIRSAVDSDREFILAANEANVEMLSPMDEGKLEYFSGVSELFLVAEAGGRPAAFLLALREGIDSYDSENYRWFKDHYDRFIYIDRIVTDERFRHMGMARKLYDAVFEYAVKNSVRYVAAEIDTIPYNAASLEFHAAEGFREVGTQYVRNGTVKVSLQVAETGR